jgi:hypothetical protein
MDINLKSVMKLKPADVTVLASEPKAVEKLEHLYNSASNKSDKLNSVSGSFFGATVFGGLTDMAVHTLVSHLHPGANAAHMIEAGRQVITEIGTAALCVSIPAAYMASKAMEPRKKLRTILGEIDDIKANMTHAATDSQPAQSPRAMGQKSRGKE